MDKRDHKISREQQLTLPLGRVEDTELSIQHHVKILSFPSEVRQLQGDRDRDNAVREILKAAKSIAW